MCCLHAAYILADRQETQVKWTVSDNDSGCGELQSGSRLQNLSEVGRGSLRPKTLKDAREQTLQKSVGHTVWQREQPE